MAKAAQLLVLMMVVAFCLQHEEATASECTVFGDCAKVCGGCQENHCMRGKCLCGCHGRVPCSVPEDCGNMCRYCSRGCLNGVCICQC